MNPACADLCCELLRSRTDEHPIENVGVVSYFKGVQTVQTPKRPFPALRNQLLFILTVFLFR